MSTKGKRYVKFSALAKCMICNVVKELRMGVCFACSDKTRGKDKDGEHVIWQADKPSNRWYIKKREANKPLMVVSSGRAAKSKRRK